MSEREAGGGGGNEGIGMKVINCHSNAKRRGGIERQPSFVLTEIWRPVLIPLAVTYILYIYQISLSRSSAVSTK